MPGKRSNARTSREKCRAKKFNLIFVQSGIWIQICLNVKITESPWPVHSLLASFQVMIRVQTLDSLFIAEKVIRRKLQNVHWCLMSVTHLTLLEKRMSKNLISICFHFYSIFLTNYVVLGWRTQEGFTKKTTQNPLKKKRSVINRFVLKNVSNSKHWADIWDWNGISYGKIA